MKAVASKFGVATLVVCLISSLAFAQTGTKAALTGIVKDPQGNGIPGASVVVRNVGTGVATTTQTNGSGNWAVPSLDSGTFEVTISVGIIR
jgi:glutamate synthase domain-containing protein 3